MLNETTIKRIRYTDKDQWINDSATRGLYLRVTKSNATGPIDKAAWVVRQKIQGKTHRNVIGHWPAMNLQDARKQRDLVLGVDIHDQINMAGLLDQYDRAVLSRQKSGNQARVYSRHVRDRFGPRLANTIRRAEMTGMIQKYSRDRGARSADRLLSFLRGVFGYGVELDYIQASPVDGVTKRVTGYQHKPRERVLTDDELRLIWTWEGNQAALLRFLTLTALRIGEAQQGYRDGDQWIVPAEISKNTDAHWVQLTPTAIEQLRQAGGSFDTSPTATQAWLKRKLTNLEYSNEKRFTPHDLRRTAATRMGDAGVAPHVIEKVLNHRLRGVAQTYNRAELQLERVEAAKLLEQAILTAATGEPS
jgi:integrase